MKGGTVNMQKGLSDTIETGNPALQGITPHTGSLDAANLSFGIVASRFNTELTEGLLASTVTGLKEHGAQAERITVVRVPGAYEIPTALEVMATQGACHALIALGAIILGETPHADAISTQVNRALSDISQRHHIPVIDGVVAAPTMELAVARCLSGTESRGAYAAKAAIEMAHVILSLKD